QRRMIITVLLLIVILLTILVIRLKWPFIVGYDKVTIQVTEKGVTTITELPQGKSLWDWLNLLGVLAIPAVVGFGTVWFTTQQGKVSDMENKDNQQEAALQVYIDKMSELLLDKNLRGSAEHAEVREIARVRTLTL